MISASRLNPRLLLLPPSTYRAACWSRVIRCRPYAAAVVFGESALCASRIAASRIVTPSRAALSPVAAPPSRPPAPLCSFLPLFRVRCDMVSFLYSTRWLPDAPPENTPRRDSRRTTSSCSSPPVPSCERCPLNAYCFSSASLRHSYHVLRALLVVPPNRWAVRSPPTVCSRQLARVLFRLEPRTSYWNDTSDHRTSRDYTLSLSFLHPPCPQNSAFYEEGLSSISETLSGRSSCTSHGNRCAAGPRI